MLVSGPTDDGHIVGVNQDAVGDDHPGNPDDGRIVVGQTNDQQDQSHSEWDDRCQMKIHDMFPTWLIGFTGYYLRTEQPADREP